MIVIVFVIEIGSRSRRKKNGERRSDGGAGEVDDVGVV